MLQFSNCYEASPPVAHQITIRDRISDLRWRDRPLTGRQMRNRRLKIFARVDERTIADLRSALRYLNKSADFRRRIADDRHDFESIALGLKFLAKARPEFNIPVLALWREFCWGSALSIARDPDHTWAGISSCLRTHLCVFDFARNLGWNDPISARKVVLE